MPRSKLATHVQSILQGKGPKVPSMQDLSTDLLQAWGGAENLFRASKKIFDETKSEHVKARLLIAIMGVLTGASQRLKPPENLDDLDTREVESLLAKAMKQHDPSAMDATDLRGLAGVDPGQGSGDEAEDQSEFE